MYNYSKPITVLRGAKMEIRINEDVLKMIVSSTSKRNEKKEQILRLKEEILELRKRGLSLSQIVEYLKKAHKLKTTTTYLKKVIPELSSKDEYVYSLLNGMSDEQIVNILVRLGHDRVKNIFRIYKSKYITNTST